MTTTSRMGCFFVVVQVACLLLCNAPGCASEAPTIDTIMAAFAHQNTATVECSFTMESINAPSTGVFLGGRPKSASLPTRTTPTPVRYVRSPGALYRVNYRTTGTVEKSSERTNVTHVAELRQKRHMPDGTYEGFIDRQAVLGAWVAIDRIETVMYPCHLRRDDPSTGFLYGWIKYGKVSETTELIDGHECWKVDITDTGDCITNHWEIWLDPSVGFCPRRIKGSGTTVSTGDFTNVIDSKNFQEIAEGIWFPTEQVLVKNIPDHDIRDRTSIYRATEANGNKTFSEQDLTVQFESGMEVTVINSDGSRTTIIQP